MPPQNWTVKLTAPLIAALLCMAQIQFEFAAVEAQMPFNVNMRRPNNDNNWNDVFHVLTSNNKS